MNLRNFSMYLADSHAGRIWTLQEIRQIVGDALRGEFAIDLEEGEVVTGSPWYRWSHTFAHPLNRNLRVYGKLSVTTPLEGVSWLLWVVERPKVEYPPGDAGDYFRDVLVPIAERARAEIAFDDDERGPTPQVMEALRRGKIPFRTEGYFLSARVAQQVGLNILKELSSRAKIEYEAYLQNDGLPTDAPPALRAERHFDKPKPWMVRFEDGSCALYGLLDWLDYWRIVGL